VDGERPRGDDGARAFEFAVRALARKERTLAEMRALLEGRGFEPEHVEGTIARLVEIGELDDERFAERFAEDKRELRGWGPERIRAARLLRERGQPLTDDRARSRALEFLARRGYDYEVAYAAIRLAERRAA